MNKGLVLLYFTAFKQKYALDVHCWGASLVSEQQHKNIYRGSERGFFVNRECLFLIAVNRERTKLFPVIRE